MKTPVASIGIRGTLYGLMYCVDGQCSGVEDGLYGGVLEGMIAVEVEGDDGLVKKNGFFFVTPDGKVLKLLTQDPGGVVFEGDGDGGNNGNNGGMGLDGLPEEGPVFQAPRDLDINQGGQTQDNWGSVGGPQILGPPVKGGGGLN